MRLAIITTVALLTAASFAQTNPAQASPAPGQSAPPAGSQTVPPAQASGQNAPATPTNPATPPASAPNAAQTPAANPVHRVLQAKSQDELKAYQEAAAKTDPAQVEAAANDFAAKYPSSELRASLYIRAMNLYAQANNSDKVIITGRQAIAADPTNPIPLVQVATVLAETTRDNDLDRERRFTEAAKDAHAAIDNVDTGLLIPADADAAKVAAAKRSIRTMAYDTLGMIDLSKSDYAAAEKNLQQAIEETKGNPESVLYLRLSVAQDKLKQYPEALDSANKAVQYAQAGTMAQNLAKQQQARLQQLINSGGSPATATPTPSAPSPVPGAQANPSPVPATPATPH